MFIIGLCGKAGCGKSTIANSLAYSLASKGMSVFVIPLAQPVKEIANMFGWDWKKDERGRKLLQQIGTDVGREYNVNIWIDKLKNKLLQLPDESIVIIDDVRFDNEVEFIENLEGQVFHILRDVHEILDHVSEHGIDYTFGKHKIVEIGNEGSLADTMEVILDLIDNEIVYRFLWR